MSYLVDWEGNRLPLPSTQNYKWQGEYDICNTLTSFVGGSFSKRDFDIAKHFFELGLKTQKGE